MWEAITSINTLIKLLAFIIAVIAYVIVTIIKKKLEYQKGIVDGIVTTEREAQELKFFENILKNNKLTKEQRYNLIKDRYAKKVERFKIISNIVVVIAVLSFGLSINSVWNTLDYQRAPLKVKLDTTLGKGNWFSYPDDNFSAIGVKRLPKDFKIKSPIKSVYTHRGKFEQGEKIFGDCGAHIELELALQSDDIPLWQSDALAQWKEKQRKDTLGIVKERLDDMLGSGNWHKHPSLDFSVIVEKLNDDLPIEFPITNVDAGNGLKYGVGMPPVKAGQGATVWLAGKINDP